MPLMPTTFNPSSKDIAAFYFVADDQDAKLYVCSCGTQRRKSGTSYQNLITHVKDHHPHYKQEMYDARGNAAGSLMRFVDAKSKLMWKWMRFIVGKGAPFSWVEDSIVRSSFSVKGVSVETFLKHMEAVTRLVEQEVTEQLPDRFGILLDGWSHLAQHFFAFIACFHDPKTKGKKEFLLAFAPPLQEDDLSAVAIAELLRSTLQIYNSTMSNVLFFAGDNCYQTERRYWYSTYRLCIASPIPGSEILLGAVRGNSLQD
jgi:hypothetical protein